MKKSFFVNESQNKRKAVPEGPRDHLDCVFPLIRSFQGEIFRLESWKPVLLTLEERRRKKHKIFIQTSLDSNLNAVP